MKTWEYAIVANGSLSREDFGAPLTASAKATSARSYRKLERSADSQRTASQTWKPYTAAAARHTRATVTAAGHPTVPPESRRARAPITEATMRITHSADPPHVEIVTLRSIEDMDSVNPSGIVILANAGAGGRAMSELPRVSAVMLPTLPNTRRSAARTTGTVIANARMPTSIPP